jgi:hypothetical protein
MYSAGLGFINLKLGLKKIVAQQYGTRIKVHNNNQKWDAIFLVYIASAKS